MEESNVIETRRRSRSKTPFLRSHCDNELCQHVGEDGHLQHRKHSPVPKKIAKISTIIEEKNLNKNSTFQDKNIMLSSKAISRAHTTSDYSSNSSEDLNSEKGVAITSLNRSFNTGNNKNSKATITTTTTTTIYKKAISNSVKNGDANISNEMKQNVLNLSVERQKNNMEKAKTSTPIYINKSNTSTAGTPRWSPISSENSLNHLAYAEYKDLGEYWKKTPKTDYTYSKLSQHRREIAPGIVAMPNMSRNSLEKHNERVNLMIQRYPDQEELIRKKYLSQYTQQNITTDRHQDELKNLMYDSQDELDVPEFDSFNYNFHRRNSKNKFESRNNNWEKTFLSKITESVSLLFSRFIQLFTGRNDNYLYQTKTEEKGIFRYFRSKTAGFFYTIFSYVYMIVSSILYLDTWLLRSSSADSKNKKRFLLFLLMLLPLLLLCACTYLEDNESKNVVLTKINNLFPPLSVLGYETIFRPIWNVRNLFNWEEKKLYSNAPLKSALNTEEYENLLNHINLYIEQVMNEKLRENNEKDVSILIANSVRDQLNQIIPPPSLSMPTQFEPTVSDIESTTNAIMKKLATRTYPGPFKINQKEITNLIRNEISVNQNIIQNIDLENLVQKLIESDKFENFIQSKMDLNFVNNKKENVKILSTLNNDNHQLLNKLTDEIDFIKEKLSEKMAENQDLHYSLEQLNQRQNEILVNFGRTSDKFNTELTKLYDEIENKFTNLNDEQSLLMKHEIKSFLAEIFAFTKGSGNNFEENDLKNWIMNLFVAKDYLEKRLDEVKIENNNYVQNELESSATFLMKHINDKLKMELIKELTIKFDGNSGSSLNENDIRKIVKNILAIYDADKTGLVDYALESAGGQVLSTRCTENYQTKSAQISIFGIPLWYPSNTPRIAISPSVQPGECWAFQNFPGFLVLKLNSNVFVTGFTIEHVPKSLTPDGKIDSAPKNFTVWALTHESDQDSILFGEYQYTENDGPLQYFPVLNKNIKRPFDIIELRIESNHGNGAYTCLYRFRVHGKSS